jgi:hypothetical protein
LLIDSYSYHALEVLLPFWVWPTTV